MDHFMSPFDIIFCNLKSLISWKSPIVFETVVADLKQLQSTNSKPNEKIVEVLSNDIIRIEGQPICKGDDQTGKPFYGIIKRNNDGSSRTASKLYCSSLDSPLLCQSSYHFLAIGMGSLHFHSSLSHCQIFSKVVELIPFMKLNRLRCLIK